MHVFNRSTSVVRAIIGKRLMSSSSFVTSKACVSDGESSRAVVLVLGFGGAKPRHVAKYAQLYNDKGCSTVAGTASNHAIFVDHAGIDVFAKDAVQQVTKLLREDGAARQDSSSGKETPIVMHIISNGGAFVSRSIGHMLDCRDQRPVNSEELELFAARLKLGCQVFDSAPCYVDPKSSFTVIKHLIPNPFLGLPAAGLFALLAFVAPAVSSLTGKPTYGDTFWNALLEDKHCKRQAFIYSDADNICDAQRVREFIKGRKERGVCVIEKRFEDSRHVQHIRQHETEYSDFVEAVLTGMEESNSSDRAPPSKL